MCHFISINYDPKVAINLTWNSATTQDLATVFVWASTVTKSRRGRSQRNVLNRDYIVAQWNSKNSYYLARNVLLGCFHQFVEHVRPAEEGENLNIEEMDRDARLALYSGHVRMGTTSKQKGLSRNNFWSQNADKSHDAWMELNAIRGRACVTAVLFILLSSDGWQLPTKTRWTKATRTKFKGVFKKWVREFDVKACEEFVASGSKLPHQLASSRKTKKSTKDRLSDHASPAPVLASGESDSSSESSDA